MTSPARVYSRIRSTAALNASSPNSETKWLSTSGFFVPSGARVTVVPAGAAETARARARSRNRASVFARMPGSAGSTRSINCIRPLRRSKTMTSSETMSTASGVPSGSGGVLCCSRFSDVADAVVAEVSHQAAVESGEFRVRRHPVAGLECLDEGQRVFHFQVFADIAVGRHGDPPIRHLEHGPAGQPDDRVAPPLLASLGGFQQVGVWPPGDSQVDGQGSVEVGKRFGTRQEPGCIPRRPAGQNHRRRAWVFLLRSAVESGSHRPQLATAGQRAQTN